MLSQGEWKPSKSLVFCLDDPPNAPDKKKVKKEKGAKPAGPNITMRNFGSFLDVSKIKSNSSTLVLAWRCRLLVYSYILLLLHMTAYAYDYCYI